MLLVPLRGLLKSDMGLTGEREAALSPILLSSSLLGLQDVTRPVASLVNAVSDTELEVLARVAGTVLVAHAATESRRVTVDALNAADLCAGVR